MFICNFLLVNAVCISSGFCLVFVCCFGDYIPCYEFLSNTWKYLVVNSDLGASDEIPKRKHCMFGRNLSTTGSHCCLNGKSPGLSTYSLFSRVGQHLLRGYPRKVLWLKCENIVFQRPLIKIPIISKVCWIHIETQPSVLFVCFPWETSIFNTCIIVNSYGFKLS